MDVKSRILELLRISDQEMIDWAMSYAHRTDRNITWNVQISGQEALEEWVQSLPDNQSSWELLRRMVAALNAKERRRKSFERKACSFELRTDVKDDLNYLAARDKQSILRTLEGLISGAAAKARKQDSASRRKKASKTLRRYTAADIQPPLGATAHEPSGKAVAQLQGLTFGDLDT